MERLDKNTLFFNNVKLVSYCYNKMFHIPYLKDDLIQAGHLGLWNACTQFDAQKGKFSTFAMKCIIHQMSMVVRQERKHKNECGYEFYENGKLINILDIEDNGEFATETAEIEKDSIINGLKHKDLYNDYLQGDTPSEIADKFGITPNNAKVRIHRSKKSLSKDKCNY